MARAVGTRHQPSLASRPGAVLALLRRLPRNAGALAILAVVTLIASFSLAALPGFVARMSDRGLQRAVSEAAPYNRNIALTQVSFTPLSATGAALPLPTGVADVEARGGDLQRVMPAAVQAIIRQRVLVADGFCWI